MVIYNLLIILRNNVLNIINPFASLCAGAPTLKNGDVNT